MISITDITLLAPPFMLASPAPPTPVVVVPDTSMAERSSIRGGYLVPTEYGPVKATWQPSTIPDNFRPYEDLDEIGLIVAILE